MFNIKLYKLYIRILKAPQNINIMTIHIMYHTLTDAILIPIP